MPLWNEVRLCCPHGDFCDYNVQDFSDSLLNVAEVLTYGAQQIAVDDVTWQKIQLYHALQRRLALKMASDKFLHLFQRVGICLKNFMQMNLSKSYLELAEIFLNGLSSTKSSYAMLVVLPSRQQVEYLLIRSQGCAKLVCQMLDYCETAFMYVLQKLSVGHMPHCLLMAASIIGYIRISFKALLVHLCELYKKTKYICNLLKCGTWQWPSDPDLPDDLLEWVDPDEKIMKRADDEANNLKFLQHIFLQNVDLDDTKEDFSQNSICLPTEIDVGEVLIRRREEGKAEVPMPSSNIETENNSETQTDDDSSSENVSSVQQQLTSNKQAKLSKRKSSVSNDDSGFVQLISQVKTLKSLLLVAQSMLHYLKNNNCVPSGTPSCLICSRNIKYTYKKLKLSVAGLKKWKSSKSKKICNHRLIENAKGEFINLLKCSPRHSCIMNNAVSKNPVPVNSLGKLLDLFYHLNGRSSVKKDARLRKALVLRFIKCYKITRLLQKEQQTILSKKLVLQTSKKMIALC